MTNGEDIKPFPQGPRLINEIDTYIRHVHEFIKVRESSADPIIRLGLHELTAALDDVKEMLDEVRGEVMNEMHTREVRMHFQEFKDAMDRIMDTVAKRKER